MTSLQARSHLQSRAVGVARPAAVTRNVRAAVFKPTQNASTTEQADSVSRRNALAAGFVITAANLAVISPAQAFLGFGEPPLSEQYANETNAILVQVRGVLALSRGDDSAEDKVKDLRKDINSWVAKYRREPQFSGKPSYGNTYSVLNALAGHFNSFGATAPIPKKRLERIVKEIDDAEKALARGR